MLSSLEPTVRNHGKRGKSESFLGRQIQLRVHSVTRMAALDHLPELVAVETGVPGRVPDVNVAKELLDLPEVHPPGLAVGRRRTAEGMRRQRPQMPAECEDPDRRAVRADKERIVTRHEARPRFLEMSPEPVCGGGSEGCKSLTAALSVDPERPGIEINVRDPEARQLTAA